MLMGAKRGFGGAARIWIRAQSGRRPRDRRVVMRWWIMAIAIGAAALAAREYFLKNSVIRYRMTVEVDTPEGAKSGSSVVEAKVIRQLPLMGSDGVVYRIHGEAAVVDLPGGQALFALLGNEPYHVALPTNGLLRGRSDPPVAPKADARERDAADWPALRRVRPLITLAPADYPLLVRFRDRADPSSVEPVDPLYLGASFGAGFHLLRITIQPTDEEAEARVEQRLPWLNTSITNYLPGPFARANALNVLNFKTRR